MTAIALVPARSGSKGFPNKNIATIRNKTLIELSIAVGKGCQQIDEVYISTDSKHYEEIAIKAGARSIGLRPAELATDTANNIDVAIHLLNQLEQKYEYVVLLQPTSPMRTPDDISNMLLKLKRSEEAEAIVSVEKFEEPHPHKLKKITSSGFIEPFLKNTTSEVARQLLPEVYRLNGAIYITKYEALMSKRKFITERTIPYVMQGSINIDSQFDYDTITGLLATNKINLYGV